MDIVQPALIIGVGGSGIDIVRRFKRRFELLYPETPYVRLLGIDTAPQTAASDDLPRLSDDEFIHAANFQMEHFVGDAFIDGHPEIREWWKGFDKLTLRHVSIGAGQRRPVGRLALFVECGRIAERLRSSLFAIFNDRVFAALPAEYRRAVNVYIVASTCGGTGTGMFLDLAYIAAHLVTQTMPQATAWVRSLLLLPSVFIDTGRISDSQVKLALRANAYGALAELDFAMSRNNDLAPVKYPQLGKVLRSAPPFRSCYLVGNRNERGAVLTDFDEILERAAVHMQIELASPLTATGEARMDNILDSIAAKPEPQGKPRRYSSFHGDWLELPSRRVLARWTKRLANRILERLNAPTATPGGASGLVERLEAAPGFGDVKSLIRGSGLNRHMPQVDAELDIFQDIGPEGEDATALIQRATALQEAARRRIKDNTALSQRVEDAVRQIIPEITRETRAIIAQESLGTARHFLSEVQAELESWLTRVREDVGESADDRWLSDFTNRVGHHKKGLLRSKARYVQEQRELVIDAVEQARLAWQRMLRARVGAVAGDYLPDIIRVVRELKERTEQLGNIVDAAAAEIGRYPEPAAPLGMGIRAIGDREIDQAFEDAGRIERMEAAASDQLRELIDAGSTNPTELAKRVLDAADHAVRLVAPEFLRTLSIPAEEIAARMNHLSPLVVFTAQWHSRPESKDVARLHLLGLPTSMEDKKETVLENLEYQMRQLTETVPHGDEERVVMTVQCHGFPLYALAEVGDCQKAFEDSDPMDKILRFVVPDKAIRNWKLLPLDPKDARRWFAIALAIGRVRRAGTALIYNAGGPRSVDIELANEPDRGAAYRAARDAFLKGGYAAELKAAIEGRLRAEGNQSLHDELGYWVREQEEYATRPEYLKDAKQDLELVRQYQREISPF